MPQKKLIPRADAHARHTLPDECVSASTQEHAILGERMQDTPTAPHPPLATPTSSAEAKDATGVVSCTRRIER